MNKILKKEKRNEHKKEKTSCPERLCEVCGGHPGIGANPERSGRGGRRQQQEDTHGFSHAAVEGAELPVFEILPAVQWKKKKELVLHAAWLRLDLNTAHEQKWPPNCRCTDSDQLIQEMLWGHNNS